MDEVIVSAPVQERLVFEVGKVEGDVKLTVLEKKKKKKRRKPKPKRITKNNLLVEGGDPGNPNTSLGATASADQEMIVLALTANGDAQDVTASRDICSPAVTADQKMIVLTPAVSADGKSLISSTNAPDKTVSHDILSPAATVDHQMIVLSPSPVQECLVIETDKDEVPAKLTKSQKRNRKAKLKRKARKELESLLKREGTENSGNLSAVASVDPKMMVLAATVDEKSSISSTNATDQIASGDILSTKVHESVSSETCLGKRKINQIANKAVGDALSAKVDEVVSGETVPAKSVTNDTPQQKQKKRRKKKPKKVEGDVLSAKVNAIYGSSATVLPDAKMVSKEEEHTEAANGKMGSNAATNLNLNGAVNSSLTVGEISTPQNLQNLKSENGETGPGTTATGTTASKKRKRGKNKNKNPLSDKVNATGGLSTPKVLDTKAINNMQLSDITNHNVDGKKGPEVAISKIGASNKTSKRKTKKQKVDVNEEITLATPGKKLIILDVNGMLADIVFPRPKGVEADKFFNGKAVFKRPYLDDFLSFCFEKFNVAIWSSRMKKNLDPVVDCLLGDLKKKLLFIWDHSHCRNSGMRTLEDRYKCIVFKELRAIWEKNCPGWVKGTFDESNTLLLDDSPYKALLNPKHTGIFPTSYKYTDTNDDYLGPTGALRAYLEGFAAADDGRTYVEQNPFGEGAIDKMNQDWKYYSRVLKGQRAYCISRGITYIDEEE